MIKLKHNKLRNTGLFFDILCKNVVHEALNPNKGSNAVKIIKKHFVEGTELFKELGLYRTLATNTQHDPQELLTLALESRRGLDSKKLLSEKYALVKSIKKNYDLQEFFNSRIDNYKVFGSIYKLFEYQGVDNPEEYLDTRKSLLESLSTKPSVNEEDEDVEKVWLQEDEDVRELGFKLLVEKFNEKYRELGPRQKTLLGKYINEDSSTNDFKDYVLNEVTWICRELSKQSKLTEDEILKIKLQEIITLTDQIKIAKIIKEDHLSSLLKYYELIEVLNEQ